MRAASHAALTWAAGQVCLCVCCDCLFPPISCQVLDALPELGPGSYEVRLNHRQLLELAVSR